MDLRCKYSPSLRVAITGSTGFVGRRLIDIFAAGDFQSAAIEDVENGSVIVHLAAVVSPTRDALIENIAIDSLVLEQANLKGGGIVYASTNNVYPLKLDCEVSDVLTGGDYYASSKILGEKLLVDMARVPVFIARVADVFGVGQRHGNLFKALAQSIKGGDPLVQYGNGSKRRTYIHVDELCSCLKFSALKMMSKPRETVLANLGYQDSATVSEIIALISKAKNIPVEFVRSEVDPPNEDVRTMRPTLLDGYQPTWPSFREALLSFVSELDSESTE